MTDQYSVLIINNRFTSNKTAVTPSKIIMLILYSIITFSSSSCIYNYKATGQCKLRKAAILNFNM